MIKEIYLKNWKSFNESKLYIDPLTIIIGTNASGKSNILDALLFLQKVSLGKQVNSAIAGDIESHGIRGGVEWAITKGVQNAEIRVTVQSSTSQDTDFEYFIEIATLDESRIEIKSESLKRIKKPLKSGRSYEKNLFYTSNENLNDPGITAYFSTNTQGRGKRIDLRRSYSILSQSKSLSLIKDVQQGIDEVVNYLAKIFILDPIPSHMRGFSPFSDVLKPDAANIAGVLAALDEQKKLDTEKVITSYLKRLPEKDILKVWTEPVGKFNSDAMLYCSEKWVSDDELIVDARGMSDGTLRFLAIMTAVLTIKEKSLLVIEEIDNGFHPSRANLLVQFLKEVGSHREIDIICTTHNPAFLDALGTDMMVFISVVYRDAESGASEIKLLEELEELPRLIARGTIGRLASQGMLEAAVKK